MAVEESGGEILARAEMEMKNDESFVMVMNGVDSDVRSDSSEKDCGGDSGDLLAADSGNSNFVENGVERERNEESCCVDDDLGGGEEIGYDGERAEMILSIPVEIEQVIDDSEIGDEAKDLEIVEKGKIVVEVLNDGNQNLVEEGLVADENDKDEKDEVVDVQDLKIGEENQVKEEDVDIDDLMNKEQIQVEEEEMVVGDSKNEKEIVVEHLNQENEVIMGNEEQVSEEMTTAKSSESVSQVEELYFSIVEKNKGVPSYEIEEKRDFSDELSMKIDSLERATEETSFVFDIEGRKEDNHEECENLHSSERDATNKELDSYSEVEERKNSHDEGSKDVGTADSQEDCDDANLLARDTTKKMVDSNLEVEETKSTNDEVSSNVPFESTDHTDDEVHSVSNHIYSENEKNSVNQLDENLQIKTSTSIFDAEGGELNTSVEEIKQYNATSSQLKSEIVGKEDESSSIKLIEESVKNDSDSALLVEDYKAAEVLSSDQSTDLVKEFIISTSQAEVENDETISTSLNREPSNKEDEDSAFLAEEKDVSFIDSKPEPTGLLASGVEKIKDTNPPSVDSNLEQLKEDIVSDSKSKDNQNAEAMATECDNKKRELKSVTELADEKALEVIEDQIKDLKTENQSVESSKTEISDGKRELKAATELTENVENHPEKNFGIKDQQKEVNSDEKQDAAPSAQDVDGEKTKMPPKKYRLIKIARFNQKVINDEQQAKITDAQMQVDEHTRRRDSFKAELDNMRKVLSDYFHKRDSASDEEKKAKALLNAKRLEMDSVQTVISKGKTAASFLDIISQIHALEHKMQHETISLKDEKKYLHELNQLKHEREFHLFNKCSQLEIDEALKQKEAAESSLRTLKKEFDVLRSAQLKADEYLKSASKSYIDQFNNVKELEQKWKAANELRQNAYKNLHSLKSDKMEHYWKYMDDKQTAKKYASLRDFDTLDRHCNEQIERIMRLWNEDDDFRRQYVESNANNTLRKFGTLDGRTLGPNDPKPVLPNYATPPVTTRSSPVTVTARDEQSLHASKVIKSATPTDPMVRSKSPSESSNDVVKVVAPSSEEFVEVRVEKKLTKEEEEKVRLAEEQARVEEELRKVKKELELKEKLRMEQKTKAKEAEERKRRKAEKAQAKAEYKAQKEADLRELKRSKKEKKKEGEKAGSVEGDIGSVTETSSQEASQEQETINRTSSKSSKRRSSAAMNKFSSKVQPIPLHVRNRGKRNISAWIWTICIVVALIALFFAGNHISFSTIRLKFGF